MDSMSKYTLSVKVCWNSVVVMSAMHNISSECCKFMANETELTNKINISLYRGSKYIHTGEKINQLFMGTNISTEKVIRV